MKALRPLVWTRPPSDWPADEVLLMAAQGKANVHRLPCVKIVPVAAPRIEGAFDVVVVTSSKAAEIAFASAPVRAQALAAKAVYTHGPSTAKTLEKFGLNPVVIQVRTGQDLAAELRKRLPPRARVLWPRVEDPAHDIEKDLNAAGFRCESFVCYRTETGVYGIDGKPLLNDDLDSLQATLADAVVCFASPSSVEGFLTAFSGSGMTAAALGPTTADACRGRFKAVLVADENGIEALVRKAVAAL